MAKNTKKKKSKQITLQELLVKMHEAINEVGATVAQRMILKDGLNHIVTVLNELLDKMEKQDGDKESTEKDSD